MSNENNKNKFFTPFNIVMMAIFIAGWVFGYAVFYQSTIDYEETNDKNIAKIEARIDKLEAKNDVLIRLDERLRHIEEDVKKLLEKNK